MNWNKINDLMERNLALHIGGVVDIAIIKHPKHSHFWVHEGELFESYQTIRGLRYRYRFAVAGLLNTDVCSDDMMVYISKEYL